VERKRGADRLYRNIKAKHSKAAAIHGDLPQPQRERIMAAFREGKITVLIATDVMSRGIDVSGISHIINYDLPNDLENYVHRIGRTGRIGKDGIAISFVTPEQSGQLTDIEMVPQLVADQACQISNPVAIKSLKIRGGAVALPGKPVLNCAFARQFVTWLGDVAAPVVAGHEDSALAAVSTGPGFQCRGRNGDASAKMSEHASGNAIDIDAIVLADKKRIDIVSVADAANPSYRLLMALRISACGYFTTVLGPGSNAAHATHYHFDLGIHGKSSNYRICE